MIDIEVKVIGDLTKVLDNLEAKVKEMVLMSGVAAMARVVYAEVKMNVPVSAEAHYFYGSSFKKTETKYLFQPGTLKAAVYRAYSPERSGDFVKTYRISWNHQKAPYGFMVEFGTSRAPAHPFLRPAIDHIQEAIAAGQARMAELLRDGTMGLPT
jgi:HK97 gp10 family phage protein